MSESKEIYIGGDAEMTRTEAEKAVGLFVAHGNVMRWLLLDMFERKAHKALHYNNWEDFCAERLGLFHSKTYHADLLRAAEVERNLLGKSSDISELSGQQLSTSGKPRIPIRAALQIGGLKDPDQQRAAWEEYMSLRQSGTGTEQQMARELKNIVARRLKAITPVAPTPKTDDVPSGKDFFETAAKTADKHRPAVSSFTPPADPEPQEDAPCAELFPIDFEEARLVLETVMAWVENEQVDCSVQVRMRAAATLNELSQWIEASIK